MTTLLLGLALGMRHGTDPDHLTAIDGLSRIRPRISNGFYFALGHGLVVTILAVGLGQALAGRAGFIGPWLLIFIGLINLFKLLKKTPSPVAGSGKSHPIQMEPFLLGMLLAAGYETASQFSVLMLATKTNPWLLGAIFTAGMIMVDGLDGYLAASTQNLAQAGTGKAPNASRLIGVLVVIFSFGLGGSELMGVDLEKFTLPVGLVLFATIIATRVWVRSSSGPLGSGPAPVTPYSTTIAS